MGSGGPLALDAAVVAQRVAEYRLLFRLVARDVIHVQLAHLRRVDAIVLLSTVNQFTPTTVNWGLRRLNRRAAHSLTGEASAGSMNIKGPIRTTPSNVDGSFKAADRRIIPPCEIRSNVTVSCRGALSKGSRRTHGHCDTRAKQLTME